MSEGKEIWYQKIIERKNGEIVDLKTRLTQALHRENVLARELEKYRRERV